jgi:tetratricopeptide (TPR) repeat protein
MYRSVAFLFLMLMVGAHLAAKEASGQVHSSTEPIQVNGQLRYQNGEPAKDVVVRLDSLNGGVAAEVRTDRLGKFRFEKLFPQQYQIIIRQPGYRPIQREVNLIMMSAEYVQLQLVPEAGSSNVATTTGIVDANVPAEAQKEFERAEGVLATQARDRLPEAIQHLEKAIALYPAFLAAELKLGVACMDVGQWDKAEQALRRALEINPKTANALFALGEIYWKQNKYDQAEQVLREGLSIESRSWQGHFTLGRLYFSRGNLAQAGKQIALTIQLNPKLAEAHLIGGNILLRSNKSQDALEQFLEYLRLAPNGEFAPKVREIVQKLQSTSAPK